MRIGVDILTGLPWVWGFPWGFPWVWVWYMGMGTVMNPHGFCG